MVNTTTIAYFPDTNTTNDNTTAGNTTSINNNTTGIADNTNSTQNATTFNTTSNATNMTSSVNVTSNDTSVTSQNVTNNVTGTSEETNVPTVNEITTESPSEWTSEGWYNPTTSAPGRPAVAQDNTPGIPGAMRHIDTPYLVLGVCACVGLLVLFGILVYKRWTHRSRAQYRPLRDDASTFYDAGHME